MTKQTDPSYKQQGELHPKFGDVLENGWAGDRNPHKTAIFVRTGHRSGRLNPGRYFVMTDGKGDFWEQSAGSDHKMSKVGTMLSAFADAVREIIGEDEKLVGHQAGKAFERSDQYARNKLKDEQRTKLQELERKFGL